MCFVPNLLTEILHGNRNRFSRSFRANSRESHFAINALTAPYSVSEISKIHSQKIDM
jgi:hypothetical protein